MLIVSTINDVARYILDRQGDMTAMKLQKLCYYSYSYHLAWEEKNLFEEHFEAWANGPVSPVLYAQHRGQYKLGPDDIEGNPKALSPCEAESVDLVLQGFGDATAHQLSAMTHREPPWINARERAKVGDLERSTEELTNSDIFDYFLTVVTTDSE